MIKRITKTQYWLLSWTWGFVMTFIGAIAYLIFLALGHKPQRNGYGYVFIVGRNWGGVSFGPFCFVGSMNTDLFAHEFGHSLQNCYWGPHMIIISLMSAARYWYREYIVHKTGCRRADLPAYDSIWFEGTATYLGSIFFFLEDDKDL